MKIDFENIKTRGKIYITAEEYEELRKAYEGLDNLVVYDYDYHYKDEYMNYNFHEYHVNLITKDEEKLKIKETFKKFNEKFRKFKEENRLLKDKIEKLEFIEKMSIKEFKKYKRTKNDQST